MNENVRYLSVGIFVIVTLSLSLLTLIWFGGDEDREPYLRYQILFDHDVSGLPVEGPVRFLGVEVGHVVRIDLAANDPTTVVVDIDVRRSTPITTGTYAALAYQGITGVAYINLASDAGDYPDLVAVGEQDVPVLPSRRAGLNALLESTPKVIDQVGSLLSKAEGFVSEQNQASFQDLLQNLDSISAELAEQDVPVVLTNTLNELRTTLQQLSGTLNTMEPDIIAAVADLRATAAHLAVTTAQFERWTVDSDAAMTSFFQQGLGQTPALIADTRSAMRALEKLANELRENPSRLIYQQPQDTIEALR